MAQATISQSSKSFVAPIWACTSKKCNHFYGSSRMPKLKDTMFAVRRTCPVCKSPMKEVGVRVVV